MKPVLIISAWARGAILLPMLALTQAAVFAQSIINVTPQSPIGYANNFDASVSFDLNGDGITDYVLSLNLNAVSLLPQDGNRIVASGGSDLVAALNKNEVISSSLNPTYQWYSGVATIGGSAIFDGQYYYDGNFTGSNGGSLVIGQDGVFIVDAYIGLEFQIGGLTHYGWMEVYNYPNAAAGQVLGWAYDSSPNTTIVIGVVPEPGTFALLALGAAPLFFRRKWPFAILGHFYGTDDAE